MMFMGLTSTAVLADPAHEVMNQLIEAEKAVQSFRYEETMRSTFSVGGIPMTVEAVSTLEWVRRGDACLYRLETDQTNSKVIGGQEIKSVSKGLSVYDGSLLHDHRVVDGVASSDSRPLRKPPPILDARAKFAYLREYKKLKVLPEARVGERDCFVIEETQLDEKGKLVSRDVEYLDKATGLPLKVEEFDEAGQPRGERRITNLQVNIEIDPQRFEFSKPPASDSE
jgi:outer membrane lipoprotein-sorting protein